MARTVDPTVNAVRREAFVDAAQRLIQASGYEQMSIQDLLDELDASRGAFYHYFDSKASLLDAVIARMVTDAMVAVEPIVEDPGLSATGKLVAMFSGIASWKVERMELLMAVLRVWLSDGNALVRERFRRDVIETMTPVLTRIVRQGSRDGEFSVSDAEHVARVLVSLLLGANEHAGVLFTAHQAELVTLDEVEGALNAYPEAFERVLGARRGSLRWFEPGDLRRWFDLAAIHPSTP
ncbi:MAG TPA: TetR/AcrR family transcriptional regulator [Candidatus Limnocylindrales bacterium]|jgi:AcrR family transcriptional regulator